ncbi:MAG: GPI biosynthesis protein family Pig-F-domain-containing protein [Linnemannia gamsii]|nr:MAG: GPI biosynthesis protein family Pig-F-domain-containing protein [Linnemannia gamsii]
MQRTTATTRQGQANVDGIRNTSSTLAQPTYPLLRMSLVAMVNLAVAYATLTSIPSWLNTHTHQHAATTADHKHQGTSNNNNPLPSLSWTLVTLFGLQTALGLIQWSLHSSSDSNKNAKKGKSGDSSSVFSVLNTSIAIGAVGTLICHVFAVLFGAGIFSQARETSQLAVYLSLLTFYPASFVLGTDLTSWLRIFVHSSPGTYTEAAFYCQGMMAIFGAWLGSIVIPLDWDRPWQAWPVPCVLGAFLFYCIGTLVGLVVSIVMRQRTARSEFGIGSAGVTATKTTGSKKGNTKAE